MFVENIKNEKMHTHERFNFFAPTEWSVPSESAGFLTEKNLQKVSLI